MRRFRKNPRVPIVIIPPHGRVYEADILEGDHYAQYAPAFLMEIEPKPSLIVPMETPSVLVANIVEVPSIQEPPLEDAPPEPTTGTVTLLVEPLPPVTVASVWTAVASTPSVSTTVSVLTDAAVSGETPALLTVDTVSGVSAAVFMETPPPFEKVQLVEPIKGHSEPLTEKGTIEKQSAPALPKRGRGRPKKKR